MAVASSLTEKSLSSRYFRRLQLDPLTLDEGPTLRKLQIIQERHLACIPFENLSQHGCAYPASLQLQDIAHKILDRHRGGFCFEVNGLMGAVLRELGYTRVLYTPAFVYAEGEFRPAASHLIVIVVVKNNNIRTADGDDSPSPPDDDSYYMCDVGFGEPPLHPLNYSLFGVEQRTPEGMRSKLDREGDVVILSWWKDGAWEPRLRWSYTSSMTGCELVDCVDHLAEPLHPESVFAHKIISTRLTRTEKCTVAGHRLKITGPPRFGPESVPVSIIELDSSSTKEVRSVLEERFGIPYDETEGLSFDRSNVAPKAMWNHL